MPPPGERLPMRPVVLVSMPFGPWRHPSLGLGLLKARLAEAGISSAVEYLQIAFATQIGHAAYDTIVESPEHELAGERVFAGRLCQTAYSRERSFRLRHDVDQALARVMRDSRRASSSFLKEAMQRVLAHDPKVVGFSSTFQQNVASLALAKELKAHRPELVILFGGANCENEMGAELVRSFPFLDAVVSGEADNVIVPLIKAALNREPLSVACGVYTTENLPSAKASGYPSATVDDLDDLPYPDFCDYFEQLNVYGSVEGVRIPFETSRGCWWGQKHHCVFCGLNDLTIAYRKKSAQRAISEIEHLVRTYGHRSVFAVDNIAHHKSFQELFPLLIQRNLNLNIFFEVKANLKKEHVQILRDAGVRAIQPGVESLSTPILRMMRKGVTALQNIQLLKCCKEFGIFPAWNFLWGFPGEPPEEYRRMNELIPRLTHLPPPLVAGPISLDRFSPHFESSASFGFAHVRPYDAYNVIYSLERGAIRNLAAHFDYDYSREQNVHEYTADLASAIATWRFHHEESELLAIDMDPLLLIIDTRPGTSTPSTVLDGLDRHLYLACDVAQNLDDLNRKETACSSSTGSAEERLSALVACGLMLREEQKFLSLAIKLENYSPSGLVRERLLGLSSNFNASLRL